QVSALSDAQVKARIVAATRQRGTFHYSYYDWTGFVASGDVDIRGPGRPKETWINPLGLDSTINTGTQLYVAGPASWSVNHGLPLDASDNGLSDLYKHRFVFGTDSNGHAVTLKACGLRSFEGRRA